MTTGLKIENVSFSYGDKEIFHDISVSIPKGKTVSIIGESGVGKTTLFNVVAGLLKPSTGDVYLNDTCVTQQAGKISYMLQKDLLLDHKSIRDNLALPLILKGVSKKKARQDVMQYLDVFGLEESVMMYPKQLSGGMRQRAALLRTYMFGNDAMLLDEPFSALDPLTKSKMHQWYLDVMKHIHTTTLFITHDIDEAIYLSDIIYVLKGSPATLSEPIPVTIDKKALKQMAIDPNFIAIKKRIYDALDE